MMSYPESDVSDILEKAVQEELYENVGDMVQHIVGSTDNDFPDSLKMLDSEEMMQFKQEYIYNEFNEHIQQANNILPIIPHHIPEQSAPIAPIYSQPLNICNNEYSGPHEFDVSIIPNGSKNPWVYSTILNKVFIDMGSQFPVDFHVSSRPSVPLFIRVTPCFSSIQHSQELVYRCIQHEQPQMNKDVPEFKRQHIIRCLNEKASYLGDKKINQRLSIVFPFSHPHTGSDAVREMFLFVCKSSCPTGMNRKPIEIIFTLETYEGIILGRKILNVRICSCPKRDKEKEEKEKLTVPQGRKRKMETKHEKNEKKLATTNNNTNNTDTDKNIYTLTIDIAGKQNLLSVLKYAQDRMAGEMLKNPQYKEPFAECYKKLQEEINQQ